MRKQTNSDCSDSSQPGLKVSWEEFGRNGELSATETVLLNLGPWILGMLVVGSLIALGIYVYHHSTRITPPPNSPNQEDVRARENLSL